MAFANSDRWAGVLQATWDFSSMYVLALLGKIWNFFLLIVIPPLGFAENVFLLFMLTNSSDYR